MAWDYIDSSEYWNVDLKWTPSIKWGDEKRIQLKDKAYSEYGMYRFERYHHLKKGHKELTYLGLAFKQSIGVRVYQHPVEELNEWKKNGYLWVSYAPLYIDGHHKKERYEEVEHLLTYFSKPREARKKFKSIPNCRLHIRNLKYKGTLPEEIIFPAVIIN
jgi:hypothetical protein